ncbi:CPBP family intramembrane glutamic endopeptidase [Ohtaekwangia sp.]|uniref:CPBP family intramembrane glutamic endopeptidase n=1 Tax=Ohtaekwangia sp. TaxID=2066019 RepID=UPI002FDED894
MNSLKDKAFKYANENTLIFIIFFVVLRVLLAIFFSILLSYYDHEPLGGASFDSLIEEFLLAVCIAPFFETYLCQYIPFHYLSKYIRARYIILLSSLLFGSFHLAYSLPYFVNAFFAGMIYAMAFFLKRQSRPLIYTAIIHAAYNLIGFIDNWINMLK